MAKAVAHRDRPAGNRNHGDLRAQARTATLQLTVQVCFDPPPPEATALGCGVGPYGARRWRPHLVGGFATCHPN
jgi:hypothetical protein